MDVPQMSRGRTVWSGRWFRLRQQLTLLLPAPSGSGKAYVLRREYGGWTGRPVRGVRRLPWVSPPSYYTRKVPADDMDAATDWLLERRGL
ncbi:hypothetical protein [Nocardia abscessus]|uniref:hypothetical protein n=1 Tax=Nocardia abscessus TaxID=120957 RepID=UPI0024564FC2|nr:hypothetical protein [Nocardia abscessus]